ncbi:MAG: CCA tRNA nucleotidyltransferase [Paracoccus sp. (in: a-proteobacteria)]|nr:CCA tRNA nucleotidyltransferase [Paracoccus sp. (in: a-proteobacteria)]
MTRLDAPFLRDPALQSVLAMLETGGHRALIVGGAVRNALIGAPVADVDIASDARPETVVELAAAAGLRTVPTGINHGTVTVIAEGSAFEVTTFRRDVATDGRRATVAYADSIDEDAQRRDFTMNALYADRKGVVLDPVGGLDDLAARRLVFVGTPEARITEDYLRILRFFRFLAWYGREAEPQALAACTALKDGLSQISAERIGAEMRRLLAAPDPGFALALMDGGGVLDACLPGASAAIIPALIAAERAEDEAPHWPRRLAALGGRNTAQHLRLSRAEAKTQALLAALAAGEASADPQHKASNGLDAIAYHHGAAIARDVALIRAARGEALPQGWQALVARAAGARLPVCAADLMPQLDGPALGAGLRAAEGAWIASGFTASRAALIAAAVEQAGGAAH